MQNWSANSLKKWTCVDEGIPVNTIGLGSNICASGFVMADADMYRFKASELRLFSIPKSTDFSAASFGNTSLAKLTGLTRLDIERTPNIKTLSLALVPNLTIFNQSRSGLTVAEVNQRLVDLDANGKTGGTCQLSQFLSGVYSASPPSGAGATAKTNLQGKGWTVTTD